MINETDKTYVTFKWMLAQTLTIIISILTIGFLIVSSITGKIDVGLASKVSMVQFEERTKSLSQKDNDLCDIMAKYSKDQKEIDEKLNLISQSLAILIRRPIVKSEFK